MQWKVCDQAQKLSKAFSKQIMRFTTKSVYYKIPTKNACIRGLIILIFIYVSAHFPSFVWHFANGIYFHLYSLITSHYWKMRRMKRTSASLREIAVCTYAIKSFTFDILKCQCRWYLKKSIRCYERSQSSRLKVQSQGISTWAKGE